LKILKDVRFVSLSGAKENIKKDTRRKKLDFPDKKIMGYLINFFYQ
jgi:hypothetical protein